MNQVVARILEAAAAAEARDRRKWRQLARVANAFRDGAARSRRAALQLALYVTPSNGDSIVLAIARTKGRAEAFDAAAELLARELRG